MMWNGPFGMMGGGGWFWPFHLIILLLFWALIIMAVVMLLRYAIGWGGHPMGPGMMGHGMQQRSPALDILEERYARGEIDRDEFLEKKRVIAG
jgi:putative membrane protein